MSLSVLSPGVESIAGIPVVDQITSLLCVMMCVCLCSIALGGHTKWIERWNYGNVKTVTVRTVYKHCTYDVNVSLTLWSVGAKQV